MPETKAQKKVHAAFREVHEDEPGIVAHTREKYGKEAAEKQRVAIALSKAREAGAKIPKQAKRNRDRESNPGPRRGLLSGRD
jgi:hypothetical protein